MSDFLIDFARLLVNIVDEDIQRSRRNEENRPKYQRVAPMIKDLNWDHEKSEKGAKYFSANKYVNLDDLIECLKCFDWDAGRADLVNALKHPIKAMNYFERQEIAGTFDWESGTPSFLND